MIDNIRYFVLTFVFPICQRAYLVVRSIKLQPAKLVDVKIMNLQAFSRHHHLKELKELNCCGGYRSRTDDPLRARQML